MAKIKVKKLPPLQRVLISACRRNDIRSVSRILESSPSIDLNCREKSSKLTPLHIAASKGHESILRELLLYGANVDASNVSGITPLMLAIENRDARAVQILLRHRADLTRANFKNETPMLIATRCGHQSTPNYILDLILRRGMRSELFDQNRRSYYKFCWCMLIRQDLDQSRRILESIENVDFGGLNEKRPLYYAISENLAPFAKLLIGRGAKLADQELFWIGLKNRATECVELLLNSGVTLNCRKLPNSWLDLNSRFMDTLFDQRIFAKIVHNPNSHIGAPDAKGYTILHRACGDGKLDNVRSLARLFPDLLKVRSNDGKLALHLASARDFTGDIVEFLLAQDDVDPEVVAETLMHACSHGKSGKAMAAFFEFDKTHFEPDLLHLAAGNPFSAEPLKFLLALDRLDFDAKILLRISKNPLNPELSCEKIELLLRHGADPKSFPKLACVCARLRNRSCPSMAILQKLNFLKGISEVEDSAKYEEELKALRKHVINFANPGKTLRDVLLMSRNQMVGCSRNEVFLEIYRDCGYDFETSFPHYGFLLNLQMQRGQIRRPLIDGAKIRLNRWSGSRLMDECEEEIVKLLDNRNLERLSEENTL